MASEVLVEFLCACSRQEDISALLKFTLNSSMILRMPLPRAPMMRAWTLLSRVMFSVIISSSSSTIAWIASRAAMAFCSYPVIVIWSFEEGRRKKIRFEPFYLINVLRKNYFKHWFPILYLVFIILLWELDVHIMLCADVCDDGALAADDFWVILWVHSDGQFEALECLQVQERFFAQNLFYCPILCIWNFCADVLCMTLTRWPIMIPWAG